jgi:hypothetical protein
MSLVERVVGVTDRPLLTELKTQTKGGGFPANRRRRTAMIDLISIMECSQRRRRDLFVARIGK